MGDQARRMSEHAGRYADQGQGMLHKLHQHSPDSRQVLRFVTVVASGATLLVLGALALGAVVITLIVATPFLIVASPVLVPIGTILFFGTAGLIAAGGAALATVSTVNWIYNYMKGRHPAGAEQVDAATRRISETAHHMRDRAVEYGSNVTGYLQSKGEEVAPRG